MKITTTGKFTIMTKTSTPSADGTKTYYKLGIVAGSECGMISASREIFDSVAIGKTYDFETVYNDQYKSFQLSRLLGASK